MDATMDAASAHMDATLAHRDATIAHMGTTFAPMDAPLAHMDAHQERTTMLEVQYRMHEAIMSAGNAHFYKGRLQAHEAVAHATLDGLRPWLWVDTAGCGFEERRSEEGGRTSRR